MSKTIKESFVTKNIATNDTIYLYRLKKNTPPLKDYIRYNTQKNGVNKILFFKALLLHKFFFHKHQLFCLFVIAIKTILSTN